MHVPREGLKGLGSDVRSQPLVVQVTTVPMSLAFLRGQVGYMKHRGFEIAAVSSPGARLESFGREEGIPVFAVEMARRVTPIRDLRALVRLVSLFRDLRPDIVHAHTPKAGLLGMIAAAMTRVPVRVYHMRGLPLLSATGWRRGLLSWTERVSCHLSHQVLSVSGSIRKEALRMGLSPPHRITVLANGSGNGVDAEGRFDPSRVESEDVRRVRCRFGIPESARVLGFVGRIVRDKGIMELAEAWSLLRDVFPDLHLLLVGPLEPRDPVPEEAREALKTDSRVHFSGMDWNTPPLYASMDVLALPTYREGFPNVPMEAAAMGLPVVATRIPGCVDAVQDGVTGTLVPVRDANSLAEAVRRYLEDPALRQLHGAAGRERMLEDFRPEFIWEALHDQYLRLLQASGRPLPVSGETK